MLEYVFSLFMVMCVAPYLMCFIGWYTLCREGVGYKYSFSEIALKSLWAVPFSWFLLILSIGLK